MQFWKSGEEYAVQFDGNDEVIVLLEPFTFDIYDVERRSAFVRDRTNWLDLTDLDILGDDLKPKAVPTDEVPTPLVLAARLILKTLIAIENSSLSDEDTPIRRGI